MTHELRIAVATDPGLVREHNEDSVYVRPDLQAVADGMGGHEHGELASAIAVDVLAGWQGDLGPAVAEIARRLDAETPQGTGTTLTAMRWEGLAFQLAHIGDSRAYVLREGELRQISHDHTMVPPTPGATRAAIGNQRTSSSASVSARHTCSGVASRSSDIRNALGCSATVFSMACSFRTGFIVSIIPGAPDGRRPAVGTAVLPGPDRRGTGPRSAPRRRPTRPRTSPGPSPT